MDAAVNPLLIDWDELGALPPFELIRPAHFGPAFSQAMASHRAELARITEQPEPADFDNTLAAFDRAGAALQRVSSVFHNLAASAPRRTCRRCSASRRRRWPRTTARSTRMQHCSPGSKRCIFSAKVLA